MLGVMVVLHVGLCMHARMHSCILAGFMWGFACMHACMRMQAIAVTPTAGRPSLAAEEGRTHVLLPCHPLRLDLALVPYGKQLAEARVAS